MPKPPKQQIEREPRFYLMMMYRNTWYYVISYPTDTARADISVTFHTKAIIATAYQLEELEATVRIMNMVYPSAEFLRVECLKYDPGFTPQQKELLRWN